VYAPEIWKFTSLVSKTCLDTHRGKLAGEPAAPARAKNAYNTRVFRWGNFGQIFWVKRWVNREGEREGNVMNRRQDGNGSSKVNIVIQNRAEGYVVIAPNNIDKLPEQTPIFISRSMDSWLEQNPTYRVRCAVPIVSDGMTIAIHVWFDEE
jgi:hypothetical protein